MSILISLLILFVFLLPRPRDFFISGRMVLQFVWLATIIVSAYFLLHGVMQMCNFQFKSQLGYPFYFINSNIGDEMIGNEWNTNVIIAFVIGLVGTILTGGLLISMCTNMLERRIERIQAGLVAYRFSEHTLFIGYDDMAIGLIREFEKERGKSNKWEKLQEWCRPLLKKDAYLIQTTQNIAVVKQSLTSQLSSTVMKNVYVLYKPLDTAKEFKDLSVNSSKRLFILNEDDNDANKIRILRLLAEHRKTAMPEADPIDCYLSLVNQSTYTVFQNNELLSEVKRYVNIQSFNFHKLWAQKVFVSSNYGGKECGYQYPDLDFEPIAKDATTQVHLVVVGMTRMGIAMALKAIRIAHYANFAKTKTRITFIDSDMEHQKHIFASRYAALMDAVDVYDGYYNASVQGSMSAYTDIEIQFINDRVENPSCRRFLSSLAQDTNKLLTIAVCFTSASKALAAGLYLPKDIYLTAAKILINQETAESIFQLIDKGDKKVGGVYGNTYTFGMKNDCYDITLNQGYIPQLVNYVYSNSFTYDSSEPSAELLKEAWAKLPITHKWSNQYNSEHLSTKVRIKETAGNDIDLLARVEHNRWVTEKILAGFTRATADQIVALRVLKDPHYQTKMTIRQLSIDGHPVDELKKQADAEWSTIKGLKNETECKGLHDCLVSFDDLNELDKHSDVAIVEAMTWISDQVKRLNKI